MYFKNYALSPEPLFLYPLPFYKTPLTWTPHPPPWRMYGTCRSSSEITTNDDGVPRTTSHLENDFVSTTIELCPCKHFGVRSPDPNFILLESFECARLSSQLVLGLGVD